MENLITKIRALAAGAASLIMALTLVTLGALSWTNAHAEIELTPHNLSGDIAGTPGPGPNTYPSTARICVFCHTPHGGDDTAEVPLWNRTLAAPGDYTTYATLQTSTLDGEEAPVGSVSIACLSCHDGTQAMDSVLNEPGSGDTGTGFAGQPWNGADRPQGIADLTQDLSNDHPIGIQYGGGGLTVGTPNGALADPDFNPALNTNLNGTVVWWVDTETPAGNGSREKTDMLLYTRSVAAIDLGAAQPFVECASCHDPHTNANPLFLRTSNDGSAVCLACHNK